MSNRAKFRAISTSFYGRFECGKVKLVGIEERVEEEEEMGEERKERIMKEKKDLICEHEKASTASNATPTEL